MIRTVFRGPLQHDCNTNEFARKITTTFRPPLGYKDFGTYICICCIKFSAACPHFRDYGFWVIRGWSQR